MTEVTKQLTCLGPPEHLWTASRPKGTPGQWPRRCPAHKTSHLRALDRKYHRAKRGSTKKDQAVNVHPNIEVPVSSELTKVLGITPTTASGNGGKVTVLTPSASGVLWPTNQPEEEHKQELPEDLQYVDSRSAKVVPNRNSFRELMRAASRERTARAYLNLAAVCVAAARLLEKRDVHQQGQGQKKNGGSP